MKYERDTIAWLATVLIPVFATMLFLTSTIETMASPQRMISDYYEVREAAAERLRYRGGIDDWDRNNRSHLQTITDLFNTLQAKEPHGEVKERLNKYFEERNKKIRYKHQKPSGKDVWREKDKTVHQRFSHDNRNLHRLKTITALLQTQGITEVKSKVKDQGGSGQSENETRRLKQMIERLEQDNQMQKAVNQQMLTLVQDIMRMVVKLEMRIVALEQNDR